MRNATLLAGLLVPTLLVAARPVDQVKSDALFRDARTHLATRAFEMGLDGNHGFAAKHVNSDDRGVDHVRVKQTYKGLPVFEGEAIVHVANGTVREVTDSLVRGINLNVRAEVEPTEALAIVHAILAPKGPYATEPTVKLVVATATGASKASLVYHVHTELENGADETSHMDFFIDARTGRMVEKWNTLHTAAATGTGRSQFSGTVTLNTNSTATGFEMHDTTRGGGLKTYNLNHATTGTGTLYSDADNTWGDGANYVEGSSTTADNGQTAAVDAQYGLATTWDMYKNVFGRNGIDNAGTATYSRVHYSNNYDNAFWSDSCFCMTYGDGSSFLTLTALDVAGHEMTHGVTSREANLTYRGESGGLNESMSDIFGTMAEFYEGSTGATIPATNANANWTIGEELATPAFNKPLRYMYKPSLDGQSPNNWSKSLARIDVHYSSGPMNRAFFFLSQGASNVSTSNFYSSYLPTGMTGIGNDKAARIVYDALTNRMTASTTYAGARTACLSAASALYGATSAEYTAVQKAFTAINVK